MLKSGAATFTVTIVLWEIDPLVPVTLTAYLPGVEEDTVSVDEPVPPDERPKLLGLRVAVRPDGATEVDNVTIPEKLLTLARLIVVVFDEPSWTTRLGRTLDMLKSGPTLRV
jgi:hypothetical protein